MKQVLVYLNERPVTLMMGGDEDVRANLNLLARKGPGYAWCLPDPPVNTLADAPAYDPDKVIRL